MTSAPLRPYCFSSSGSSLAVSMPSKAAVMPKARMFFGSVVPSALLSSFQDRATVRTFGFLPSSQAASVTKMPSAVSSGASTSSVSGSIAISRLQLLAIVATGWLAIRSL